MIMGDIIMGSHMGADDDTGAGFLWLDALPDANHDVKSWHTVRS